MVTVTDDMVLTFDAARASAAALLKMVAERATSLIDPLDYLDQWLIEDGYGELEVAIRNMSVADVDRAGAILSTAADACRELEQLCNERHDTMTRDNA